MTLAASAIAQVDARDVGRMVSIPQVLRHFGWRTRQRGRADCRLCRGNSTGTVAFTERLWRCHRCNEGGDVFSLVRAVNHCGFPEALRVVAGLAGVKLGRSSSAEIQVRQHQHEQEEVAAAQWERQERMLRLEAREDIHALDRVKRLLSKHPDREDDELWAQLEAADTLKRRALGTYLLLSFGELSDRYNFVFYPEARATLLQKVVAAGAVGRYHIEDFA